MSSSASFNGLPGPEDDRMDALVLHAIGDLRFEQVKRASPEKGEVLLEIKASGICGSDIARVMSKGTYRFPMIPGHEFAGRIVAAGEGADPALVGRRAAVFPMLPCRKCDSCIAGEYATCSSYDYFGSRRDGGFAGYLAVPVWNLVLVPDSLSYEEAAMAEPAAVAIHALRRGGIQIGDSVAVAGCGPIGLMLASWAKASGAAMVFLWDIDAAKISFARSLGFEHSFNSSITDPKDYILEHTGGKGVDLAVEGAGVSGTLTQCIEVMRPFGTVVAMGNPAGDMNLSQKTYWEIMRRQLTIKGTWNSSYSEIPRNEWKMAVDAMGSGALPVKSFITHRFALGDGMAPFVMMKERKTFFNKVMYIL
ncbi:MAG: galactitol-1-phosphate 5-dehydrogenase [Saccharofermentanales bacterium]